MLGTTRSSSGCSEADRAATHTAEAWAYSRRDRGVPRRSGSVSRLGAGVHRSRVVRILRSVLARTVLLVV